MPQDLPFLLREQARDRFEEYKAEHAEDSGEDPAGDEDRLEPGPGQVLQEQERLRHAAEMAEAAYRLAEGEQTPGS